MAGSRSGRHLRACTCGRAGLGTFGLRLFSLSPASLPVFASVAQVMGCDSNHMHFRLGKSEPSGNNALIIQALYEAGYPTECIAVSPCLFGIPVKRWRLYWVSVHAESLRFGDIRQSRRLELAKQIVQAVKATLRGMQDVLCQKYQKVPFDFFVLPSTHQEVQDALSRLSERPRKQRAAGRATADREVKWKKFHQTAYANNDLVWIGDWSDMREKNPHMTIKPDRELDIMRYHKSIMRGQPGLFTCDPPLACSRAKVLSEEACL